MKNLGHNVDVVLATSVATESTAINSRMIDMAGRDGCMFIALGSTTAGAASIVVKAQMSTANSTAALTNVTGSSMSSTAVVAAALNNRLLVYDCARPTERYLRMRITGSSSGSWNIIAIPYNLRRPGSTAQMASTTVAASTVVVGLTS